MLSVVLSSLYCINAVDTNKIHKVLRINARSRTRFRSKKVGTFYAAKPFCAVRERRTETCYSLCSLGDYSAAVGSLLLSHALTFVFDL